MTQDTTSPLRPRRRGRTRRKSRGALAVIGSLLLCSALLRVGVGAGEALAREETGAVMEAMTRAGAPPAAVTETLESADTPTIKAEADIVPALQALDARETRLTRREEALAVRMQALRVAEQEIDRRLAALETAEQRLRDTIALARTAAEDDITQLTDVYANMKPKQAAALFEEMDPQFAAGFLGRMRADSAAEIMARMTPDAAYLVSVVLAGRNADVPTD